MGTLGAQGRLGGGSLRSGAGAQTGESGVHEASPHRAGPQCSRQPCWQYVGRTHRQATESLLLFFSAWVAVRLWLLAGGVRGATRLFLPASASLIFTAPPPPPPPAAFHIPLTTLIRETTCFLLHSTASLLAHLNVLEICRR